MAGDPTVAGSVAGLGALAGDFFAFAAEFGDD
jgi:hypothetical protein